MDRRGDGDATTKGVSAIRALINAIDSSASVVTDGIPESLTSDFFEWLLYKLSQGNALTDDISLDLIREMTTSDGMFRGARFTEDAALERLEVASLLAKGNARFGPAKLCVACDSIDATFEFELFLDGGFSAFRTSSYGAPEGLGPQFGVVLVEDLWWRPLPAMRAAYNSDAEWTNGGHQKIKDLAVKSVAAQLSLRPKDE